MPRRKRALDAFLFPSVIVALVIGAVITIGGRIWWLPPLASRHGQMVDFLFITTLIITGTVFVLVQLTLAYFVFRYRGGEERRAVFFPEHRGLELAWTIIPAVILTVLILTGGWLWGELRIADPPKDAFIVEVWGEQFKWAIRYPGRDGKFGRVDLKLVDDLNPLGIDMKDPAAKDDIFFPAGEGELHVPVDKPVLIILRSKDVIHSFYLPHFRVKQDAVPGMVTRVWFVPTRKGEFEFVCAELCGSGHYTMRGIMIVEEERDVRAWLDEQLTAADLLAY